MRARMTRSLMVGLAAATLMASAADAQVNSTVVLKSGERHSGVNLNYRIDRARVVVREGGSEPSFAEDQVAYVEFANIAMPDTVSTNGQEAVQLRDGSILRGNLVEMAHGSLGDFSTPYLVIIDTDSGQRRLNASEVARVFFTSVIPGGGTVGGGSTAATDRGRRAIEAANRNSPRVTRHVSVPGGQAWTATGIQVRENEQITMAAFGQVAVGGGNAPASPAGTGEMSNNNPLATAPTGTLIGRIGNGRPFVIGSETTLRATDDGQLMLGINDSAFGDNTGTFEVDVVVNARRR